MFPSYFQVHPSEPLTDLHWSHLQSLLRENQPPSDLDKQTLAKVEHDIEEYDLAIARLQSAVVSLQSHRDAAKDYVSRLKSLRAPIHRLPNDILVEIFTYLCADTILNTCVYLPQLRFSQVCKYWQSLFNNSPLLWSTPQLWTYGTCPDSIPETTLLDFAKLILNRSGNCPLKIRIYAPLYSDVHPVSALFLQHADRWLSASVNGCHQRLLTVSSFLQLKHLDLSSAWSGTQNTPAMPSLESLAISRLTSPSLPNFPWKQLKRLALDVQLLSRYAFDVSRCIQLQHLALNGCLLGLHSLPVSIASQTLISLTLIHIDECEKFYPLLQFPQLHSLELYCCSLPAGSSPFIAHSLSITSLPLKYDIFSVENLLALLRLLPTVTHFSFHQTWWEERLKEFFSKLRHAHPSDPMTILPRLTHMEMKFSLHGYEDDPATSAFVQAVKSRVAENRLKSLTYSVLKHCLNHDLISSLAYLPKVGVAIRIWDKCGRIL